MILDGCVVGLFKLYVYVYLWFNFDVLVRLNGVCILEWLFDKIVVINVIVFICLFIFKV